MEIQEILDKLGNEFYEVKRLINPTPFGGYCAYSIEERALGKTFKEALENLLKIVEKKRNDKVYES